LPGLKNKQTDKAAKTKPSTDNGETGKTSRVVFQLNRVTKNWSGAHGFELTVPELVIRQGEKVALVGFSGCGKSTLLDLLAMILQPDNAAEFAFFTAGEKRLDVADTWKRNNLDRLARARMRYIGYVLQTGGLLPFLSVYDNIA
jgi:putative ABC transport system ATP-binding protein